MDSGEQSSQACIWVDADACPRAIRDILFRAASRSQLQLTLVANHAIAVPASQWIRMLQVEPGFDVADDLIARRAKSGDLVVTSDIPLAAEVIDKGAAALSPRGEIFDKGNIRQRLNMRDFMDTMRASAAEVGGGPPPLGPREKQQFANALDRYLAKQRRGQGAP